MTPEKNLFWQCQAEMKELSKALTGIIQCCVDTSISGEDVGAITACRYSRASLPRRTEGANDAYLYLAMLQIEINSSASFLAAAGAVLAQNNALIEILMDLHIVDDGCVKPKIGA